MHKRLVLVQINEEIFQSKKTIFSVRNQYLVQPPPASKSSSFLKLKDADHERDAVQPNPHELNGQHIRRISEVKEEVACVRVEQKSRTVLQNGGRALSCCKKIAPGMPWKEGNDIGL
ncbi:hypothetical protein TNCV_4505331 [Trichonephila clavipes]|nr:hypothetical protein TNCV_4505331 [Trichonephila clavipes]